MDTAEGALQSFLLAFSRLDLDALLACFAAEATGFFPLAHDRERLDDAAALGEAFARVIARLRAAGATHLPLDAADLRIQEWGDTAVATFHLRSERFGRRTCVLRRLESQWRIVHLHASNEP